MSKTSRQRKAAERRRDNGQQQPEPNSVEEVLTAEQWGERLQAAEVKARIKLLETTYNYWDNLIDPNDAFRDDDGNMWTPVGGTTALEGGVSAYLDTEQKLTAIRAECRNLALTNEFAINAHENRISYIVGSGHSYTVEPKQGQEVGEKGIEAVQTVVDEFVKANRWHQRQQEIVRRLDRDGECFLRFFPGIDGKLISIRFVEPSEVSTPVSVQTRPNHSFGIHTDPDDVETVLGYWINGEEIDAKEVQHRKSNVDSNVKRGCPLMYPVRKNLRRAEKLQRNMTVAAEIQTAIAMLRKHAAGTKSPIEAAMQARADHTVRNESTGKTTYHQHYMPGTILDAPAGTEYDFPAQGIDASRYVAVKQSELRGIASRLVMPEFMLTSDASNANYSSTMVAEGPAVKYFERLQWDMIVNDRDVLDRVLEAAVAAGKLDEAIIERIEIHAEPPNVQTRDELQEAQKDKILHEVRAMSARTISEQFDLDPDVEQKRLEEEDEAQKERWDPMGGLIPNGDFPPKQRQQKDRGGEDEDT